MNGKSYDEIMKDLQRQYQEAEALRRERNEQKDIALTAIAQMLSDDVALQCLLLYPAFESIIGQTVEKGFKFTYNDKLCKVIQPELTIQAQYPPGTGTESLYEYIDEKHAGTAEDPIPYPGNMELAEGKYYIEDGITYYCFNGTGQAVPHKLSELVDLNVHIV